MLSKAVNNREGANRRSLASHLVCSLYGLLGISDEGDYVVRFDPGSQQQCVVAGGMKTDSHETSSRKTKGQ